MSVEMLMQKVKEKAGLLTEDQARQQLEYLLIGSEQWISFDEAVKQWESVGDVRFINLSPDSLNDGSLNDGSVDNGSADKKNGSVIDPLTSKGDQGTKAKESKQDASAKQKEE